MVVCGDGFVGRVSGKGLCCVVLCCVVLCVCSFSDISLLGKSFSDLSLSCVTLVKSGFRLGCPKRRLR